MFGRLSPEQRIKIQFLHQQGLSFRKIASKVGCSVKTVDLWCKRKFGSINGKKRPKRQHIVYEHTKRRIINEVLMTRTSSKISHTV